MVWRGRRSFSRCIVSCCEDFVSSQWDVDHKPSRGRASMKEYIVSIDVYSDQMSLAEISEIIGIEAGVGSRDRGYEDWDGNLSKRTILTLESEVPQIAELDEHFAFLLRRFNFNQSGKRRLPEGVRLSLTIGILYDTVTCSLKVSAKWLGEFAANGLDLDVSCYPVREEE